MTYKQIAAMLETVGIPTAYYQFPEGTTVAPPFICFLYSYNDDFAADNTNYQKIEHLAIELYTDTKDFDLEQRLESVLSSHGLVYTRNEQYLASERMMEQVYELDVLITEETT